MAEVDGTGLLDADAGRDVKLKSFTPDELLTCDVCSRANAPTRAACMYCGAPLTSKTTISSPETEAEPQTATVSTACYVVVPPELLSEINENLLDQLAKTIEVKDSDVKTVVISNSPLVIASTNDKANKKVSDLRQRGIDSLLVTDGDSRVSAGRGTILAIESPDEART